MATRQKATQREKMQIPRPIMSPKPTLWVSAAQFSTGPLIVDPSLATDRLRPNAKFSSFPLNQLEIIALYPTVIFSPPRPKTNLPIIIIVKLSL